MRRLVAVALLALAPACSRPAAPAGALPATFALLPEDASLVAHVDLDALRASPLWAKNRSQLDADPDARRTLDALAACGVPFESLHALDLAVAADGWNVAAVLTGDGVGDPERITCLGGQLPERDLRLDRDDPEPVLVVGSARGYFHGPSTLVFTTPGWQQAVAALRANAGPPGSGPLAALVARLPPDRPIWFAGRVPAPTAVSLAPALSGLQELRGALDLREGLGVELHLGMDGEARAGEAEAELRRQLDALTAAGLPAALLERVELGRTGAELHVAVRLSMAEISLLDALSRATKP